MKLPSRSAAAAILCALAYPLTAPTAAAPKKTAKPKAGTPRTKAPAPANPARADSLRKADSLARSTARLADSLRTADSTSKAVADSARLEQQRRALDSTRRSDSLVRSDSISRAARTWFVAQPRDFSKSTGFPGLLRNRLALELGRGRGARCASAPDTSSTFEGSWKTARTSGSGRMIYTALYAGADSGLTATSWVFDLSDGRKIDSAKARTRGTTARHASEMARGLLRTIRPTLEDSACQADSALMARRAWAVAPIRDWSGDTAAARGVRDSLVDGMRRNARVSWRALSAPDSCRRRRCLDSTATAAGIEVAVHPVLSRAPDSTWILSLWTSRTSDGATLDSIRVTGPDAARLAGRALPDLLPRAPGSCPSDPCGSRSARDLWTFHLSADYGSRSWLPALLPAFRSAFRLRDDRQFLSLPDPAAPVADSLRLDSAARALSARKLLIAHVTGSDSTSHTLRILVKDLVDGSIDTFSFRRGGKPDRVVPWMARHAASLGESVPCGDACRTDSLRRRKTAWAIIPDPAADPAATRSLAQRLAGEFSARKVGRLAALPDSLPCGDVACIDSVAWAGKAGSALWTSVYREQDSSWTAILRVRDPVAADWTDSTTLRDTGAPAGAWGRLSVRAWDALAPRPHPCDSCASTDTLEAGLAVATPSWSGAPDSAKSPFLDSLVRALSSLGDYQILRAGTDSALRGDSASAAARLRCRTGATFLLRTSAQRGEKGWTVRARIEELATGRVVSEVSVQDRSSWTGRPAEMSPWLARRLLGQDSTAIPPKTRHRMEIPWGKILLLGIPLVAGTSSVIYHW